MTSCGDSVATRSTNDEINALSKHPRCAARQAHPLRARGDDSRASFTSCAASSAPMQRRRFESLYTLMRRGPTSISIRPSPSSNRSDGDIIFASIL